MRAFLAVGAWRSSPVIARAFAIICPSLPAHISLRDVPTSRHPVYEEKHQAHVASACDRSADVLSTSEPLLFPLRRGLPAEPKERESAHQHREPPQEYWQFFLSCGKPLQKVRGRSTIGRH